MVSGLDYRFELRHILSKIYNLHTYHIEAEENNCGVFASKTMLIVQS